MYETEAKVRTLSFCISLSLVQHWAQQFMMVAGHSFDVTLIWANLSRFPLMDAIRQFSPMICWIIKKNSFYRLLFLIFTIEQLTTNQRTKLVGFLRFVWFRELNKQWTQDPLINSQWTKRRMKKEIGTKL